MTMPDDQEPDGIDGETSLGTGDAPGPGERAVQTWKRLIVAPEQSGLRLDALIAAGLAISVRSAQKIVGARGVRRVRPLPNASENVPANEPENLCLAPLANLSPNLPVESRLVAARKGERVRAGDVFEVRQPDSLPLLQPTPEQPLQILFEDDHLVAINKPAGLASHPLNAHEPATVASALIARFPSCAAASTDPREGGLVHRLDRETSGVLLAARSKDVWSRMRVLMGSSGCEKGYLALVEGMAPPEAQIEAAIGHGGPRGGRAVIGSGRGMLPARSVLSRITPIGTNSLVHVRLVHGRFHQVRAHLAHIGFPIVGDATYGTGVGPLHLHADWISFRHPVTDQVMNLQAPRPDWAAGEATF